MRRRGGGVRERVKEVRSVREEVNGVLHRARPVELRRLPGLTSIRRSVEMRRAAKNASVECRIARIIYCRERI